MLQDFLANRPAGGPAAEPRHTGFQSLLAARAPGLAARRTDLDAEPEAERLEAPEIELIHDAGQVRRIIVTCKCCEKITIDCEY